MVKLFLPLLISQATANGKVGQPVGASSAASATASASAAASANASANARAGAQAWSTTGVRQYGYRPNPQSIPSFKTGNKLPGKRVRMPGSGGGFGGGAKWLPWGAWNECTGVCGQGVQSRVRRCLNGVAGIDCSGDSLGSKKCTTFKLDTCSYWSGWGAWSAPTSSCNPAKRCKTRTCYGRNTDHCEGPTECCEDVIYPDQPCTQTTVKLPAELCCPYTNPFCGIEQTIERCGPCYAADQRYRIVSEIPIPMPLCPVTLPPTEWQEVERECSKGERRVWYREIKSNPRLENGLVVWGTITPEYKKENLPTVCSGFMEVSPCTGAMTALGQCPGTITQRQQCQCYSDLDKVDQFGVAIVQTNVITCGAPRQDTRTQIVDATGVVVAQYAGLTEVEIGVTCRDMCLNKGLKVETVNFNPCTNSQIVTASVACGINPPLPPAQLVSSTPCPGVVCEANVFATETWQQRYPCSDKVDVSIKNVAQCAIGTCSSWSEWSACDESFPAACNERERTRSRSCDCPGNQLQQTTTCAPVPTPAPVCSTGPCLNTQGLECGPGLKTVSCTHVCLGVTESSMSCNAPIEWTTQTDVCNCPLEGDLLGREWRWEVATTPACNGLTRNKQEYWCDTFPAEWTEWTTEWSTPTHKCANQCDQFKYRCKTCDGAPSAECARKYGAGGFKTLTSEGGICGTEFITSTATDCNSRCGNEGTRFITVIDECKGTKETRSETCINPFVIPAQGPPLPVVEVYKMGSTCCGGTSTQCFDAIVDQGTVCKAKECFTVDIEPIYDVTTCQIPDKEWSSCVRQVDGFCYKEKEIRDVCGAPIPNERTSCSLGLTPWTWVGGLNVNSWLNNNPWNNPGTLGYCDFGSDDVNRCSGMRTQVREPICKNDPTGNYMSTELRRTEACGLQFVPGLKDLTPDTIYTNVPHYHPVGTWSECGMGVDLASLAASGQFVAEQVLTRRAKCAAWKDVEIRRPCPVCATTPFGEWSECSEVCGVGKQVRYQMCIDKEGTVLSTTYGKHETRACGSPITYSLQPGVCAAAQTCDGTAQQCGSGTKIITKRANHVNAARCQPLLDSLTTVSSEPCETGIPCPYWSAWSTVDYSQCHQEPSCMTAVPRFRTCQGRSETCDCDGVGIQKVTCMANEPLRPNGPPISTQSRDCLGKCPGAFYTTTQNYVCGDSVEQTVACEGLVDKIGLFGPWDRTCGQCDTGTIYRSQTSLCTGNVVNTESKRCVPVQPNVPWGEWDKSQCTSCGGQMVRRKVYPCPELWSVEEQYTVCPEQPAPISYTPWSECSRDCWKDPSAMVQTTISVAKAQANQCGSNSAAYSYSSIQGYESMEEVRSANAWNDDGANLTSRPGYYPGYKGGWKMRRGINQCTQEVVTTQYEQCGTCKCPSRNPRSSTAVQCAASADACSASATSSAMATATCNEVDLMQPECAYLKNHWYFQQLCRSADNQVAVQCTANAMPPTPWTGWGTCIGANGLKCASVPGEMGTYLRTRYEGCGNNCAQASQTSACQLPDIGAEVTISDYVETQCAPGTMLGFRQATKTIKNKCTGAVSSEVLIQGTDISLMSSTGRYTERMVKACAKTIQCGRLDVTREEYEIYDRCTKTTSIRYGNECKTKACPYFSAWQTWESCSKSCGEGTRRRIRYCIGGEVGDGHCIKGTDGSLTVQTSACNRGDCCNWEWSGWTGCCYNQARDRAVRYRFQLACGADQVTGIQGDCYTSVADNNAQAIAQADATAFGSNAVATATATVGSSRAIASCDNIGTDRTVYGAFHNPDKMQFSGGEFRVMNEINVDMSDPTFAAVSRAYMTSRGSYFNSPVVTTTYADAGTKYYGGNMLSFPYGNRATAGATATSGAVIGGQPVLGSNASATASAEAVVGQPASSASATAKATSSSQSGYVGRWGTNNYMNFLLGK
jgi:hypothetical protein